LSSGTGGRSSAVLLTCIGVALTTGVVGSSASPGPSLALAKGYVTGATPAAVAIVDLNGDGKPDLVTANDFDATVSVLIGNGGGSFLPKRDYPTGSTNPDWLAVGDLNGDGKPDLVTANAISGDAKAYTVSVLINKGDGSFVPKSGVQTGGEADSVAMGDLNGDGKPDLATANALTNTVSVLTNTGGGSFPIRHDYRVGKAPQSAVIGDLNGDGKADVAAPNLNGNSVSVLINDGAGGFLPRRDFSTGSGTDDLAIGDLNGDGKPDLVTANQDSNTVSVLLNAGGGSFRAKRDYATGRTPQSVAIGDLNADGRRDVVTTNGKRTASVLVNSGGGSLESRLDYPTPSGSGSVPAAIGDLNGDGKPDLVTANGNSNTVSVLMNAPGFCTVQNVRGRTLAAAKLTLGRANCRRSRIRRAYSGTFKTGRVISQRPTYGTALPKSGTVILVVSRGRKR
jgi:hypothetical protein